MFLEPLFKFSELDGHIQTKFAYNSLSYLNREKSSYLASNYFTLKLLRDFTNYIVSDALANQSSAPT